MSSVNDYVNIMRVSGNKAADANPGSEMSQLKRELIEHYKGNPMRAWALVNGIEAGNYANVSAEQRIHYEAAVIAVRGYNAQPIQKTSTSPQPQEDELKKLERAGWKPLNASKPAQLLNEKIILS